MKKLLIAIGFVMAASAARASTYIPVLMSTATNPAVQAGTSAYSFHVASGTTDNFTCSTMTATRASVSVATITTANLTNVTGTVADSSTMTHTGAHTFSGGVTLATVGGTITDNSTTTHTGSHTFATVTVTTITPTNIVGVTNGLSANAGNVGEYLTSAVARSVGKTAANAVAQSVSTRTLTAGDWNLSFCGGFKGGAATSTDLIVSISTTSNTHPPIDDEANPDSIGQMRLESTQNIAGNDAVVCSDTIQINISSPATYYLVQTASFSAGTITLYGNIAARRVR